jgi:multisubunit Na+/H+ antiporter MnhB subunit
MNMRLFQTFVLFGFYVIMTQIDAPDGARAGFLTAACIALLIFVVHAIKTAVRAYREKSNRR